MIKKASNDSTGAKYTRSSNNTRGKYLDAAPGSFYSTVSTKLWSINTELEDCWIFSTIPSHAKFLISWVAIEFDDWCFKLTNVNIDGILEHLRQTIGWLLAVGCHKYGSFSLG